LEPMRLAPKTQQLAARLLLRVSQVRLRLSEDAGNYKAALADVGRLISLAPPSEHPFLQSRRALTLIRSGDAAAALKTAAAVEEGRGPRSRPRAAYMLGRVYALAAKDGTEAHRTRALELLQQAAAARIFASGPNRQSLREHADFATLRDQAAYQKLLKEVTP